MTLTILQPGVQATLQGTPRIGARHLGVPASGPADPLSMALANRLVGNASDATTIEITFGGAAIRFDTPVSFAVTGAQSALAFAGRVVALHAAHTAQAASTSPSPRILTQTSSSARPRPISRLRSAGMRAGRSRQATRSIWHLPVSSHPW
jgi:hypothetical protein